MDLLKCQVCDPQGNVNASDIGKSLPKTSNNYTFYAREHDKDPLGLKEVLVTMPVGGNMGLFRFPRVGEWVLIGNLGETTYESNSLTLGGGLQSSINVLSKVKPPSGDWVLLSYFILTETTDKNTPFYPQDAKQTADNTTTGFFADQLNPANMKDFIDDNGMAIRYMAEDNPNKLPESATNPDSSTTTKPQTTLKGEKWSEIGFYNKKAKWPDTAKTFDETDEGAKSGKRLEHSRFSRQDVINIKSAGDIESRAANYHLIKAKRFELLANANELSPELRADNDGDNWKHWSPDNAPLGDAASDDPAIHSGDVHIRAGKNIIIKAAGEIRLQVGRTVVVIDDTGFSVTSGKVSTNAALSQTTSLSLKARGGIDMFGENVNIASSRKFSIADAWGGGLASMVGMLSMSGIQISQKTYGAAQQQFAALMNMITLTEDMVVANVSLAAPNKIYSSGWINYGFNVARMLINNGKSFYDLWGDYKNMTEREQKLTDLRDRYFGTYVTTAYEGSTHLLDILRTGTPDQKVAAEEALAQATVQYEKYRDDVNKRDKLIPSGDLDKIMNIAAGPAEPIETAVSVLNMILGITAQVYFAVEKAYARSWRTTLRASIEDSSKKAPTPSEKAEFRDALNVCAMEADNAIIQNFLDIISMSGIGGPAAIRLQSSGDIIIKAGKQQKLYAEASAHVSVPVSIAAEKVQVGIKAVAAVTKLGTDVGKLAVQGLNITEAIPSFVEKL